MSSLAALLEELRAVRTASEGSSAANGALVEEVRALRAEVEALRTGRDLGRCGITYTPLSGGGPRRAEGSWAAERRMGMRLRIVGESGPELETTRQVRPGRGDE